MANIFPNITFSATCLINLIMEAWLSSFPMIPISLVYSFRMNDSFMNGVGVPSVKCQISISANFEKQILKILFCSIFKKIHKKFKQHSINIKNYTAHPHDLVHVPAKFWEITAMRFGVTCTVRKLNVTDGQTDGGRCNISRPQDYGAGGR